jgi:RHS repeat-associated protein
MGGVRRIETAYDTGGRPYLFTSFDAPSGGNIVNQVQESFDGLGQLTADYQAHAGAVNTSSTPSVQYGYTEMAGGVNNSRQTTLTYPNGRVINYNYATGLADRISRLSSISDNSGTLEAYTYLGLATLVQRSYPQPGIALSYIKQSGEPNGDGGDQYTGLDRFGRVSDQRWLTSSTGATVERFKMGYDRDSNVLYRTNEANHAFDELYHAGGAGNGYDNLGQLTAFERGVLTASQQGGPLDTVANPSHSQSYALDAQGNWLSVTTDGTAQTRTFNQQNEATAVGSATPAYDANGNMTRDEHGQQLTYDAWNRLVQVKDASNNVLASYKYDGLGRRIQETSGGVTRDLYYSAAGQVLEEQVAGVTNVQYVWSAVDAQALVERDRDPTGGGNLTERLYVLQDANYNVVALVNTQGQVVEQYAYDPYGVVTVYSPTWAVLPWSQYAWRYYFQGMRRDLATGYDHTPWRDRSPTFGEWLQPDPSGIFGGGDTNLYRFVADDPINATDPSGLARGVPLRVTPQELAAVQEGLSTHSAPWATPEAYELASLAATQLLASQRCMACHGTGVLTGRDVRDVSAEAQIAIMRWTRTTTPEAAQAVIGRTRQSVERVFSRVEGTSRVVGGAVTAVGGLAATETGVGAVIGVPLCAWSGDQIGTGLKEIWQGRYHSSLGAQAIQSVAGTGVVGQGGSLAYDTLPPMLLGVLPDRVPRGGVAVGAARERAAVAPVRVNCFPSNTFVGTDVGLRPIGQVQPGERVWAYDFHNGTWRLCVVECRHDSSYDGPIVTLDVGVGEVSATAYHPFWVVEGQELQNRPALRYVDVNEDRGGSLPGRWVNSHDLREGDVIFLRNRGQVTVRRVMQRIEQTPVCNLTVEDLHTFAVGEMQVLVHNTSGTGPATPPAGPPTAGGASGPGAPHPPASTGGFGPGRARAGMAGPNESQGGGVGGLTVWDRSGYAHEYIPPAEWPLWFPHEPYPAQWANPSHWTWPGLP